MESALATWSLGQSDRLISSQRLIDDKGDMVSCVASTYLVLNLGEEGVAEQFGGTGTALRVDRHGPAKEVLSLGREFGRDRRWLLRRSHVEQRTQVIAAGGEANVARELARDKIHKIDVEVSEEVCWLLICLATSPNQRNLTPTRGS